MARSVDELVAERVEKAVREYHPLFGVYAVDAKASARRSMLEAFDAAGFPAFVEALSELLVATDAYVDDAAPQEELNGVWLQHFGALSHARVAALKALGGGVVSGRAELEAAVRRLRGLLTRAYDDFQAVYRAPGDFGRGGARRLANDARARIRLGLAAVDGETTTTGGSD